MSSLISPIYVPDEGPEDATVVFVGEAPGVEEEKEGRPFIGTSGNKLETVLLRNGLPRETVRLANLAHNRPKNNKFELLLGTSELQSSVENLHNYLRNHRPVVLCTLGNWPTWFFTGKCKINKGRKQNPISGILKYRGSILPCSVPGLEGLKVVASVHPAAILRDPILFPIFDQDIKRVKQESEFPELNYPKREFIIAPKGDEMIHWTEELLKSKKLACDVENVKDSPRLLCVGFAPSPSLAVVFEYNESDPLLRECLYRILSSPIPKGFHFGTHDTEILYLNGYEVVSYTYDTFVSQHVMWPELPRSLAFLTSQLTREPFYKDEVKEDDPDTKAWSAVWASKPERRRKLYGYNGKDCCTLYEVMEVHEKELQEGPEAWRRFYEFEMGMLPALHSIMRAGMLVDEIRMAKIKSAVELKLGEQQRALNSLLGVKDGCNTHKCKCGKCINANSWKQCQVILYDALKLPPRFKKGDDGESKRTTEENALVSLIALCKEKVDALSRPDSVAEWKRKLLVVKLIVMIRGGRKMKSSYLDIRISDDKRMRGRYKWGAETGRLAGEKYVDGTGCNPQTFPRGGVEVEEDAA